MSDDKTQKPKRSTGRRKLARFFLTLLCIIIAVSIAWICFALIGRINADTMIPDSAMLRLSAANPARLIDRIIAHESLDTIVALPEMAQAVPLIAILQEHPFMQNRLLRFAAR